MAKRTRYNRRRQAVRKIQNKAARTLRLSGLGALVLALVVSAVITVGEHFGWPTPTWSQIYAALDISPEVQVPSASEGAVTRLHFIDAGQADATLVEQDGAFALVDAGLRENEERLAEYLWAAGVEELDYLVLTHPHADHIGGMAYILTQFPVCQVLLPSLDQETLDDAYGLEELLEQARQLSVPIDTMEQGNVYPLGEGRLEVITTGVKDDNLNNMSPVMRFVSPALSLVLTGDAESPVERQALSVENAARLLEADVLKAGHHGSSTSNTQEFVQAVAPDFVVVSCGAQNDYGHPHEEALAAFESVGANVYRTDQLGDIVLYVDDTGAIQVAAANLQPSVAVASAPSALANAA